MRDETIAELNHNLTGALDDLVQLRDEIRVKVHLAGLDARTEWGRLEPRVDELEGKARGALDKAAGEVAQGTREALDEVIEAMKRLRKGMS